MKVKLNGNDFYQVTCPFGSTDPLHPSGHTGIDLAINEGTKLFSPVNGIIEKVADYGNINAGKCIVIKTDSGERVIMGHLSDFKVSEGQSIHQGDLVALSGNTGHSTGSHLHLGLKDENGSFIDPQPLLNDNEILEGGGFMDGVTNTIDDVKSFTEFMKEWQEVGFFKAMYGKSFFQVTTDFFAELFRDIGIFILSNADIFLLLPAIVLMFGTFMVGKNKYSKWIIPLWFAYFVCTFFHKVLL